MECPYCKSNNIKNLKVQISRPIGAKKHKCLQCNLTFITNKTECKNNNLIQILHENNKT
jgi:transposase-like protein